MYICEICETQWEFLRGECAKCGGHILPVRGACTLCHGRGVVIYGADTEGGRQVVNCSCRKKEVKP